MNDQSTAPAPALPTRLRRQAGRILRKVERRIGPSIPTLLAVTANPHSLRVDVHPTWHHPFEEVEDPEATLLPQRIRHVLVWRTNQDPSATAAAQSLHRAIFARTKTTVAYVSEKNPNLSTAPTMLDVVERLRPSPEAFFPTRQSCLVIIQDPYSTLPITVAHTWPGARVIVVLTRQPSYPLSGLAGVEALLFQRDVTLPDDVLATAPFQAEFEDLSEVNDIVRALWNVARPYPHGHLSIIKGTPDALRDYKGSGNEDIVVAMPPQWANTGAEFTDFRSYLYTVWSSAKAVAIHSKFTYSYESLVATPDVNLFLVLIDRGARVSFTTAAAVTP